MMKNPDDDRRMQKLNAVTLPWPTDWAAVFGRRAPLILEIGFGRGQFLLHLARTFPDYNVIGLEISNRCLVATEGAIEREKLPNVRVVHGMAETAMRHLFEPETLAQVHVNFPDPWFKTRHGGRRLMQRDTLEAIADRMEPGGRFYLATDIVEYAEMSAALLAESPLLDNLLPTPWAPAMEGRIVTKYERLAQREGRPCHYFSYQRNQQAGPHVPARQELDSMPHMVFTNPLSLDEIQAAFQPWQETMDDGSIVHVLDSYRGRHTVLFETFIKEETIEQRVAILLHHRHSGDFTLQVSPLGHPRATPALHQTVSMIGRWILGLHPDAVLKSAHIRDMEWN